MLKNAPLLAAAFASFAVSACGGTESAQEAAAPATEAAPIELDLSADTEPAYVETRSILDGWPGANPPGIAILEDVEILGRDMMRIESVANRTCPLPKYANFELGNNSRSQRHGAHFYTASTPAVLTISGAMKVFNPSAMDGSKLAIDPTDEVELKGVTANNWVKVDINGEEFELEVSALAEHSNIEDVLSGDTAAPQLWLKIACENNLTSWFLYDEMAAHPDIAPSLNDPMVEPADLTDEDIAAIRARDAN